MSIATALLLAFTLLNSGKPAKVVESEPGKAIVVIEGRPGCRAEALNGDPTNPVVVCHRKAAHQ